MRRRRIARTGAPEQVGGVGVAAALGANAAGGDVINSVAMHAETVLPSEAYAPIPGDAAAGGLSNIPRVHLFVGRTVQLDALDAVFAVPGGAVPQALSGLGGVGKSSLAAHWAMTRATSRVRWWITADSPAAVGEGLAALARALQPGLAGLPEELQVERALQWLAGQTDWLLVLDNVDHPDHIRPLLDRLANGGRVLVTTRRATGWHHLTTATLRLDVFTAQESLELFTRILTQDGPRDTTGAAEVCEELGHLVLAIEQAASFCHESGTMPYAYLEMLHQWPAQMYAQGPVVSDTERTVALIWRLTLDRLAEAPLAGQVLRILAWYAPDHIPRSLLDGLEPPPHLAAALGRLLAYSMISENVDGTLTVHRLVQHLARTPQPGDPHRTQANIDHARAQATARLQEAFPAAVDAPSNWPECRVLLPHVEALARHGSPDSDTGDMAYLLNQIGVYQQLHGAGTPAISHLRRAVAATERALGRDDPSTLNCRHNLAGAYGSAGDFKRAIALYKQTLADRIRVLGEGDARTLITRNSLAVMYENAGDLKQAIRLHEQNLASSIRVHGEGHPGMLGFRHNLAHAYASAGDLKQAIRLHEQTLADRIRVLGEEHPDTLYSRHAVAVLCSSAGDLIRAVRLHKQTLADRIRILGEEHPDTLHSLSNLAAAYGRAGNLKRAIPLLEQTLADRIRIQGGDHPHTLVSRSNLATAYASAGDLKQAIRLHEQTLADRIRILGEEHPETLGSRHALGHAYALAGDLTQAIRLHERNLVSSLGKEHPQMLASCHSLAIAYALAGDSKRALVLLKQNLAACEKTLGPDNPLTVAVRTNLAALTSGIPAKGFLGFPGGPDWPAWSRS